MTKPTFTMTDNPLVLVRSALTAHGCFPHTDDELHFTAPCPVDGHAATGSGTLEVLQGSDGSAVLYCLEHPPNQIAEALGLRHEQLIPALPRSRPAASPEPRTLTPEDAAELADVFDHLHATFGDAWLELVLEKTRSTPFTDAQIAAIAARLEASVGGLRWLMRMLGSTDLDQYQIAAFATPVQGMRIALEELDEALTAAAARDTA